MKYRLKIHTSDLQDKTSFLKFLHDEASGGFYARYIFRFFTIFERSPSLCEYNYDMTFESRENNPADNNIYRPSNSLNIFLSRPEYDAQNYSALEWEQSLLRNYAIFIGRRKRIEWILPALTCCFLAINAFQLASLSRSLSISYAELFARMFPPADTVIMLLILCLMCFSVIAQIRIGTVDRLHESALKDMMERKASYHTPASIQKLVYPKNVLATVAVCTDIICMILVVAFLFMRIV